MEWNQLEIVRGSKNAPYPKWSKNAWVEIFNFSSCRPQIDLSWRNNKWGKVNLIKDEDCLINRTHIAFQRVNLCNIVHALVSVLPTRLNHITPNLSVATVFDGIDVPWEIGHGFVGVIWIIVVFARCFKYLAFHTTNRVKHTNKHKADVLCTVCCIAASNHSREVSAHFGVMLISRRTE